MKNKLKALIAEQKALTAKFEEFLNETNYAFIGDKDRAEDIKTFLNSTLDCERRDCIYFHNIKTSLPDVYLMGSLGATHKHFEDYTIVDLKCEPDFFKKHSNSETPNNPDPKKVYIKGHPTRGAEVIKMLERLGGENNKDHNGKLSEWVYLIIDGNIWASTFSPEDYTQRGYTELHLPEEVNEVDSQTKEIALIEGEVYENEDGCVWIHEHLDVSDSSSVSICGLDNKGNLHLQGWFSLGGLKKSAKTELLFDIIKDNNKYFDKENMRLLDVEEFSLKDGDPFICKMNGKLSVEVFAYYKEPFGVVSYNNYTCTPLMPFNHQTKHLIGTTNSPAKHYKFVEK